MSTLNKVTPELIKAKIKNVEYYVIPGSTCTICNLMLENGFSVRGESACVDPLNFNKKMGEEIAYENAEAKIWELEGYLMRERIYQQSLKEQENG